MAMRVDLVIVYWVRTFLFDRVDGEISCAAKCRKPWTLTIFELPKDTSLQVYDRDYPLIHVALFIVGGRQNGDLCFANFFTMKIFHFMIAGDQHPLILVAELNDLSVRNIRHRFPVIVQEPFMETLYSKPGRG
jgi:hypothetical protein